MSRHGMGLGMMMEIHLLNSVANTVWKVGERSSQTKNIIKSHGYPQIK
jgi:hypothetical protein